MARAPNDDDFMTPTDVVNELSFDAHSPDRPTHRPSYRPLAPPPASPPPLPPPLDALQQPLPSSFSNTSNDDLLQSSYQHSSSSQASSLRRAEMPRVTHYTDGGRNHSSTSSYRGDASLRPNTGEINSAEGEALNERLHRLQIMIVVTCTVGMLMEIPVFLGNALTLHPSRAVLGIYLIFFSLLLGMQQVHTPYISNVLRDNVGILFHPLGKSMYLFLLGGLCIGQAWVGMYVVGGVFWWISLEILYSYIKYPHYRRQYEDEENNADLWAAAKNRASRYSWASPETIGLLQSGIASNGATESSG